METKPKIQNKLWMLPIALVLAVLVAFMIIMAPPPSEPLISILSAGSTNVENGELVALLKLHNEGKISVERLTNCTIYWKVSSGISNYSSISLPTNYVIRPGKVEIIAVSPPPDAVSWNIDVQFVPARNPTERTIKKIWDRLAWSLLRRDNGRYDHLYICFGPEIISTPKTNLSLPAGSGQNTNP
jgi:hypothetical protein